MIERAEDYRWSSAAAHCGKRSNSLLKLESGWSRHFRKQRAGQTGFLLGMERKKFSYSGAMLRKGCLAVLLGLFKNWAGWLGVYWNIARKVVQVRLTMETKGSVPF